MLPIKIETILGFGDHYLRNVSVDNVIFGYHDKQLKVLLQRPFVLNKWTVTGGYIKRSESIEGAAERIALSRTGLKGLFLQQFLSFGTPQRASDPDFNAKNLSTMLGVDVPTDFWIFDYFVSLGFYTLTEFSKVKVVKGAYEADCAWWPIDKLPPMMFDHHLLIDKALTALRLHIAHYPIGYELLAEKFTLPEMHSLYETILDKKLDIRNFSKKLLATGIVIKLDETKSIGGHRSPYLYRFDLERYKEALKTGVMLVF